MLHTGTLFVHLDKSDAKLKVNNYLLILYNDKLLVYLWNIKHFERQHISSYVSKINVYECCLLYRKEEIR